MNLQPEFENEFFLIMNKEAGVLSTPPRFAEDSRPCLGTELQRTRGRQIFPVHRLDFEVSGLVIYALTADAHRAGNEWFEKKQIQKTYRALTTGPGFEHWPEKLPRAEAKLEVGVTQNWRCRLLKGKKRAFESPQGKDSQTRATYWGKQGAYHAWDLQPLTGRSHQLRYELSRHGLPILGDKLYGSAVDFGEDRIALRAYLLDFSRTPDFKSWGLPPTIEISPHFD